MRTLRGTIEPLQSDALARCLKDVPDRHILARDSASAGRRGRTFLAIASGLPTNSHRGTVSFPLLGGPTSRSHGTHLFRDVGVE